MTAGARLILTAVSLERLLERQAGVVTLVQAATAGMSPDTVRRRARTGRWEQLYPRVYLVGGHRLTGEARVWAAWLWAGERATVCGPAAGFRYGMLKDAPDVLDLVLPAALHRRPVPGVRLHRRDLLPVDRVGVGGLQLTGRPLTALETALALSDGSTFLDRGSPGTTSTGTRQACCPRSGRPSLPPLDRRDRCGSRRSAASAPVTAITGPMPTRRRDRS